MPLCSGIYRNRETLMRRFFLIIISLLLFTACASAPSEVQKENDVLDSASVAELDKMKQSENSSTASSAEKSSELEYASLAQIRQTAAQQNSDNNSNVLVKKVLVPDADAMPAYTVRRCFDNYDKIEQLVPIVYNEPFDKSKLMNVVHELDNSSQQCKGGVFYEYQKGKMMGIATANCGGLTLSTFDRNEADIYTLPEVRRYRLYMGEAANNDEYTMHDGKTLKVGEAIKKIEQNYNEHYAKMYDNTIRFKVKELVVRKFADGTHAYVYDMQQYDKYGCPMLTCVKGIPDCDEFDSGSKPWLLENDCHGYVTRSSVDINDFILAARISDKVTDKGEKLLTFGSALNKLGSTLATSALYDMDIASLENVAVCPAQSGILPKDDRGELCQLDERQCIHSGSCTFEVRPFWVFRDFEKSGDMHREKFGLMLVDAITGDVYVY